MAAIKGDHFLRDKTIHIKCIWTKLILPQSQNISHFQLFYQNQEKQFYLLSFMYLPILPLFHFSDFSHL